MKPDLVALKQRVLDAKAEFERWTQANCTGQTAVALVNRDVGYGKARSAYLKAISAYDAALKKATQ